ncbi:ichor [Cylas formicarius]|uniref:ichor n=1 Tax=Cylas formicarius TaxID=197179 RepID=UPI002958DEFC|nr:ichor [Cylas formicarius]
MDTMKYPNVSGNNMAVSGNDSQVDEVDSIFTSSCWQSSNQNDFIENNKLILDNTISNLGSDKLLLDSSLSQDDNEIEAKVSMEDALDGLLNSQSMNLAELKPLPPFTGYTANLSINGIPGHHYHTISQRVPEENNNYSNYNEQNIVSSSTCNINVDSAGEKTLYSVDDVVKLGFADCVDPDSVSSAIKYEDCTQTVLEPGAQIKTEMAEYDISSIEDIAAIIGSAIADTTVPNNPESDDPTCSRDSWMDIDAWIDGACGEQPKSVVISQDSISEFLIPNNNNEFSRTQTSVEYSSKGPQSGSTLQGLLTHGNMPLLQYRLQNGPPIKQESSNTSNYTAEIISTSSPPSNVVSTTENLLLTVNGRFMSPYGVHNLNENHRIRSPDMLGQNYPHTTTITPSTPKKPRRPPKKQSAASSTIFSSDQTLGLLGKEKPVHRCSICNRGFLNKSNIKVHLRTHTGEKPFRCDTCAKAFRQKAHLLKHQQIHKRIGRD